LSEQAAKPCGKRVYFESYGCASNRFDLEVMLALLLEAGFVVTDDAEAADILLINTCAVKTPTESRMLERIRKLSLLGKPLIIAGCLPKINLPAVRKVTKGRAVMLDPYSVHRILEAVEHAETHKGERIIFSEKPTVKLAQPKIRTNKIVEIVQIAEGCTGACAYCCVRFARGKLFSYPKSLILERIKRAVSEGVREVWITSQDSGAYGMDIGTNLAELLREIVEIDGGFFVRVGMMNPKNAMRILNPLIEAYKDRKIFKFLHIPLQSGDNEVLRLMNRPYTVEDFMEIVNSFRREIPQITIATDIICGFPGESREAFERTLKVLEEIKPDVVNVSKFFPRPGTPAKRMRQVPYEEVKARSRAGSKLALKLSLERNRVWVGWEGRILIDEKGTGDSWIGRNFAYKPVVVRGEGGDLLGKFLRVRVVEAHETYLEAEVLDRYGD